MKLFLSGLLFFLLFSFSKSAIASSGEFGSSAMYAPISLEKDTFLTNSILKDKKALTALTLCVFMGPLGVHRLYLGTSITTVVAYIVTGAGFGILWFADTILLFNAVFRKDLGTLKENRHFFIWN